MSDDKTRDGEGRLLAVVAEAKGRLRRIAGREHLREKAWWVLGAGAVTAACRPWVWRLADGAPLWTGIGRALALFAVGSAVAATALILRGRRRGPSEIGAARAVDDAIGTSEVIASGFAFAKAGREEPVVVIARKRAAERAISVDVRALFPLPSLRPSGRAAAVVALSTMLAVGAGGYERALVTALISPPTANENIAAAALEAAAAELATPPKDAKDPTPEKPSPKREKGDERLGSAGPALADKAKEAARAARRGDRRGALEKLEELRAAGAQRASTAGDIKAALRKMADALGPSGAEKSGAGADKNGAGAGGDKNGGAAKPSSPSRSAEEAMRLLADKMRSPEGSSGSGSESDERVLERLERAAEEARRAAGDGRSREANEAARALSRAAESMRRGDRQAASQALAQAAERAAAMEQMRAAAAAEAQAIAEMLERSGELERAIQLAMLGKDGEGEGEGQGEGGEKSGAGKSGQNGEGNGKGEGKDNEAGKPGGSGGRASELRRAIMARLAAMGAADAPEDGKDSKGSGPHLPDRQKSKRAPLEANGSIRAPSQVGEGPKAIQAISGLGKGSEPPAEYKEVFPSYDAAAEEGLADERIPAQRRAAVRRYFQSIRPEQGK